MSQIPIKSRLVQAEIFLKIQLLIVAIRNIFLRSLLADFFRRSLRTISKTLLAPDSPHSQPVKQNIGWFFSNRKLPQNSLCKS